MTWRRFFVGLVLVLSLGGLAAAWWAVRQGRALSPDAIPSRGGEAFTTRLMDPALHFSQNDPRWAGQSLGGTEESIGEVGCTLCCVAMAMKHQGLDLDPASLNAGLTSENGFTPQGWIIWGAVDKAAQGRLGVKVYAKPSHADLDGHLRKGEPVTVKFFLPLGIPHWVLVVGKEGRDYLIHDPAFLKPGARLTLAERTSSIHSMRAFTRPVAATASNQTSVSAPFGK